MSWSGNGLRLSLSGISTSLNLNYFAMISPSDLERGEGSKPDLSKELVPVELRQPAQLILPNLATKGQNSFPKEEKATESTSTSTVPLNNNRAKSEASSEIHKEPQPYPVKPGTDQPCTTTGNVLLPAIEVVTGPTTAKLEKGKCRAMSKNFSEIPLPRQLHASNRQYGHEILREHRSEASNSSSMQECLPHSLGTSQGCAERSDDEDPVPKHSTDGSEAVPQRKKLGPKPTVAWKVRS